MRIGIYSWRRGRPVQAAPASIPPSLPADLSVILDEGGPLSQLDDVVIDALWNEALKETPYFESPSGNLRIHDLPLRFKVVCNLVDAKLGWGELALKDAANALGAWLQTGGLMTVTTSEIARWYKEFGVQSLPAVYALELNSAWRALEYTADLPDPVVEA